MYRILLSFSIFLASLSFFKSQTPVSSIEYQALVDFYNAAGGMNWSTKWDINNNTIHEGKWPGVKAENGHITEVVINNNNIKGSFPNTFSNLKYLKRLSLVGYYYNHNALSAASLPHLSGLESLQYLNLSYCSLSGSFPDSWGKLRNLTELYLEHNQFSGGLPAELGELTNLEVMSIYSNGFTTFPSTIQNLTKLKRFSAGYNKFTTIPQEFEKLAALTNLELQNNEVANTLAILGSAVYLNISYQTLSVDELLYQGDDIIIPALPKITTYNRTKNDFSERNTFRVYLRGNDMGINLKMADNGSLTIPKTTLASLRKGDEIYLRQTSGTANQATINFKTVTINQPAVPQEEYKALVDFYTAAGGNNWSNKWDISQNNLHQGAWYGVSVENGHITAIDLYNNRISGTIPASFSNLKFLRILNLSGSYYSHHDLSKVDWNNISGLTSLENLNLSYTRATEILPESLSNLKKLKALSLASNTLTGLFEGIGNLKELSYLDASENQLITLPTDIGGLISLQSLILNNNKLKTIPKELESLTNLKNLKMEYNEIFDVLSKIPQTVNMPVRYQTLTRDKFTYTGSDVVIANLENITKYNRTQNDYSEKNVFRLYLNDSSVGQDIALDAEGNLVIPKSSLLSIKSGDKVYLLQNSGTAYGTRIYFSTTVIDQLPVPDTEYQALVDFYNSTGGQNWNTKWNISSNNLHEGAWPGVSIENGHVVEINLVQNNLRGDFPATLGNLKYLKKLVIYGAYYNPHDFSNANLDNLSRLESLEYLDLGYCKITKQIPDSWAALKKLKVLSFYDNDIKGAIPEVLGQLTALEVLNYYSNSITAFPASVGNLAKLANLEAGYNNLTTLRKEFESLSALKELKVYNNNIRTIEAKLLQTVALQIQDQNMDLPAVTYTGADLVISNLPEITTYDRQKNDFSARNTFDVYLRNSNLGNVVMAADKTVTIPKSMLTTMKNGDEIYLRQNNGSSYISRFYFKGNTVALAPIPDTEYLALVDFYNAMNGKNWYYTKWDITKNNLNEGAWPGLAIEDGHITAIVLTDYYVKGSIPASIGNLKYLKNFSINGSYNDLSSTNLDVLAQLTNLEYIDLNNANLQSSIPASWANLSKLRALHLYGNGLKSVDKSFSALALKNYNFNNQSVYYDAIEVGANELTIELPLYMIMNIAADGKITFDAKNSFVLYVNGNKVSEALSNNDATVTFGNISTLKLKATDKIRVYQQTGVSAYSNLYYNSITFGQPVLDSEYQALKAIYTAAGGDNWTNKWTITENNLHIVSWFGVGTKGGHVISLNLPSNNLSGTISEKLADLTFLKTINLQNNHLTGTLPTGIENLKDLEIIDVNTNQLSGELPAGLASLSKLKKLSVSNNLYTGSIPAFLSDFMMMQHLDISSNSFDNIVKKLYYDFTKTYIDLRNQRITDSRILTPEGTRLTIRLSDISRYSLEQNNYEAKNSFALLVNNITHSTTTTNADGDLIFENIRINEIPATAKISIRQLTGSFKDSEFFFGGIKDGSSVPVAQAEYEALVGLYNALNGENWTNKWNISQNNIHNTRWFGISNNEGHITAINLPANALAGVIPSIWTKLPYLNKINVSGNKITDFEGQIPTSVEVVIDRQTADMGGLLISRDALLKDNPINRYEHATGQHTPQTYLLLAGELSRSITLPETGLKLTDVQSQWNMAQGQKIELRQLTGSAKNSSIFYTYKFKNADANIDGLMNILDVQSTLNYILQNPNAYFNKAAADTNQDSTVNILDVVAIVKKIQDNPAGKTAPVTNMTARAGKAILTMSGNKLILDTQSYTIASFDIRLKNVAAGAIQELVSSLGYTVSVKEVGSEVSIVGFSMGSTLNGRIEIAQISTADTQISSAILADSNAEEVPYEIQSSTLATETVSVAPKTALRNYPNPFSDETYMEFDSETGGEATLSVYNAVGILVSKQELNVTKGKNKITFQRKHLPTGMYVYTITTTGGASAGKMIIK